MAACCAVFGVFALSGVTGSASAATGTLAITSATSGTLSLSGTVSEQQSDCTTDPGTDCSWVAEGTVESGSACTPTASGMPVYEPAEQQASAPFSGAPVSFTVSPDDLTSATNAICLYLETLQSPTTQTTPALIAGVPYKLPQASGTATVTPGTPTPTSPVQFDDVNISINETGCIAAGCNWQPLVTVQSGTTCASTPAGTPYAAGVVSGTEPGEPEPVLPPPLTVPNPSGNVVICAYIADTNLHTAPTLAGSGTYAFPARRPAPGSTGPAVTAKNTKVVKVPTKAKRKTVLGKKGQKVTYKTVKGALVHVSLIVPKKVAKKAGLKGTVVGGAKAIAPGGKFTLEVRVSKKDRAKLARYHRKYKLTVRAVFTSGGTSLALEHAEVVK